MPNITLPIPIPYDLEIHQLVPEAHTANDEFGDQLCWLVDEVSDPDEGERIMRAAVVLYHEHNRILPFGQCLSTAIIWERG